MFFFQTFKETKVQVKVLAVVLLLVVVTGAASYRATTHRTVLQQQARIESLERQNRRLEALLTEREQEKNEMMALADSRWEELADELRVKERQLDQLWEAIGKEAPRPRRRRALSGSRAGRVRRSPEVRKQYGHLDQQIKKNSTEIRRLRWAALEYRVSQLAGAVKARLDAVPSLWPCEGELNSKFGPRYHPVYGTGRLHSGVDVTAPYGTAIRATAGGTVISAKYMSGYGNTLEIDHGRGLTTVYAHCRQLLAQKGDRVEKGQVIAEVGTTGVATGPHVHYEVNRNGQPVDPEPYMRHRRLTLAGF